jgi:hypothetical protein
VSESLKIALTALGGIIVFVLGQIVLKLFIEPIQEQKKVISDVVYAVIHHSHLYLFSDAFRNAFEVRRSTSLNSDQDRVTNPELFNETYQYLFDRTKEGSDKLRELSAQIHRAIQLIPCYRMLELFRVVHKRDKLLKVAEKLVEWSNNPTRENSIVCQNEIIKLLNVKHIIEAAKLRESQGND